MYLCNRLALCRCTEECGNRCIATKNKDYAYIPQAGQKIITNNLNELNFYLEVLRYTDIEYRVEGFIIHFV